MENEITHIAEVDIKKLWGVYDFKWNLNSDVNILSGINGSGKSTILDLMSFLLTEEGEAIPETLSEKIQSIKITFNNSSSITFENISENIKTLEKKASKSEKYKNIVSNLKSREGNRYRLIESVHLGLISREKLNMSVKELNSKILISTIKTFDNKLKNKDVKYENEVKTDLDLELWFLQKRYLDFQVNLGKKIIEAISQKSSEDEILEIQKKHDLFKTLVNRLFASTNKTIANEKNELSFVFNKQNLLVYKLSSGEKQVLIILLTVLLQDKCNSILFMDEPEISLHFNWQRKIIEYVNLLNPNAQLIIATHSPAMIIEGWSQKVFNVQDLIVNND